MRQDILRNTTSLSPETFKEVDAKVICEDDKVYLEKTDENGKAYKTLIEKDVDFYKMQTEYRVEEQVDPRHLQLYVSSKCNLKCPLCYENVGNKQEITLEEVQRIASENSNKFFVLMGREPTCHKDTIEMIRAIARKNRPILLTNGIKLADYEYTARLKEAGLEQVMFSFNGFDDEVYKKLNGKPLLDIKLKALDNIRTVGIKTIISVTIARGVNDNQLRRIADYCIDNRSFIIQMRVRTATELGRHIDDMEIFCMSDMIKIFAEQLGLRYEDILKEQTFWTTLVDELGFIFPSNAMDSLLKNRLCSYVFTVFKNRNDDTFSTLGSKIDLDAISSSRFKKPLIIYNLMKALGMRGVTQNVARMLRLPLPLGDIDHLMIYMRCWPNIYNIDLVENRKCPSMYMRNGEYLPFCYSNILDTFKQHVDV